MSKTTAASVERDLRSAQNNYKESAAVVKAAHRTARQAIKDDPMTSDLAKKEKLEALDQDTRGRLDGLKADQLAYEKGLRDKIEKELRGAQSSDAASVVSRRDAADRARKISDPLEAMQVLQDAVFNDDSEMAHAIGTRARNNVWLDVAEAWQTAYPETADSAAALSYVEANTSGAAYNMANNITYSAPLD